LWVDASSRFGGGGGGGRGPPVWEKHYEASNCNYE
jgi:hypothetical protein